jgi:phosphoglycerol transferase MdoB-like AlkP superfamily enzyme
MTLMRVSLYVFFGRQGHSFGEAFPSFLLGLRFDLRTVAVVLLAILILASIPPLNPFKHRMAAKAWLAILAVIVFILLFLYTVDFAHYSYLTQRLNASVLNYLEDAGISLKMVWQSYPVIWLVLTLLGCSFFIFWLIKQAFLRAGKKNTGNSPKTNIISFIVFFLLLGLAVFGRLNQYPLRWSDAFALGSDYKANLALNPFESFLNSLKFRRSTYDANKLREYYPLLAKFLGVSDPDSASFKFERKFTGSLVSDSVQPNIVLVICESFSAYKSSMWGNPLNTTPFFDSISKRGLFFDRCFTPTYGTARGVWATITGIPDVETPTTASRNPLAVDQQTIINQFRSHEKFYFLGGSTSWANIRGLLTNNIQGLQLYEEENYDAPKIDVWGISDKNLFLEANKVLASRQKPFFAVIQTADNHRPYTIPEEDLKEFNRISIPLDSLKKYGFESLEEMNAFRYTDYCFKKFMTEASKQKYFSNTVFVFIGDHGIPGDATSMFPKAWTDQRLAVEHVPLLFYAPGIIPAARSHRICSQVDVMPTIAALLKIPYSNTTLGRDLTDSSGTEQLAFIFDPDYSQIGVVQDSIFFRRNIKTGAEEIVSIVDNADAGTNPAVKNKMPVYRQMSEAIYEGAKYMLLHNKKKQ